MIQVKCFEEGHDTDLEDAVNDFLASLEDSQLVDFTFSSSHFMAEDEQIFSFSACVLYRMNPEKQGKLQIRRK